MESNELLQPITNDGNLPGPVLYMGVVYCRTNISDTVEYGKKYVGCTTDEHQRQLSWDSYSSDYAGPKINVARQNTPKESWSYASFPLFDTDLERLLERLKAKETEYIDFFDSYENGYNGNRGGVGVAASVVISAIYPDGTHQEFLSLRAAAEALGVSIGTIQYYADIKSDHTRASDGLQLKRK
jgi:hypothetical protein